MLATFLICLLLAEGAVRLWVPVRSVGPVATSYDPVYGKSLKKSYSCRRTSPEFTYRLTTNSLGFRGPEPAAPLKDAVLFLGDSMTMGSGVNDGEEFPDLIRGRLAEQFGEGTVPVVNAAVAHNGNGRWVKFLRNEAERFDPRFVLMQCHPNDFFENAQEHLFELSESGQLRELAVPPRGIVRTLQAMAESIPGVRSSYLMAMARQVMARRFASRRATTTAGITARWERLTLRMLEEALGICDQHGWPVLAIVTQGSVWQYKEDQLQRLRAVFDGHGAPVIEIPSKREWSVLYYERDPHWNAGGHKRVADIVYERMLTDPRFGPLAGGSTEP